MTYGSLALLFQSFILIFARNYDDENDDLLRFMAHLKSHVEAGV